MLNVQQALDDAQRLYLEQRDPRCPGCGQVHGIDPVPDPDDVARMWAELGDSEPLEADPRPLLCGTCRAPVTAHAPGCVAATMVALHG